MHCLCYLSNWKSFCNGKSFSWEEVLPQVDWGMAYLRSLCYNTDCRCWGRVQPRPTESISRLHSLSRLISSLPKVILTIRLRTTELKKIILKNIFPLISIILAEIFSHSSMWTWPLSYSVDCLSALQVSEQEKNQIILWNPQMESWLLWWFIFTHLGNECYYLQCDTCYK